MIRGEIRLVVLKPDSEGAGRTMFDCITTSS